MLEILFTLLPLLVSVAMLLIWAVLVLVVVVRWVISQFQAEKAVSAAVTLLVLILLPVASILLSRAFSNKDIFLKADSKLSVLSELVDRMIEGSPEEQDKDKDKDKDASSPADASAASAQEPGSISDEDLLALARQAYPEMVRLDRERATGDLLPHGDILLPLDGASIPEGFLVEGYSTLEQLQKALDELWYSEFAHVSGQEAPYLADMYLYAEADGAVYVQQVGIGGPEFTPVVDELVSREGETAIFRGHGEGDPTGEEFRFSLIFEDGRWKYGQLDIPAPEPRG